MEEDHEIVTSETYRKYIQACGGYKKLIVLVLLIIIVAAFMQGFQIILSYWT